MSEEMKCPCCGSDIYVAVSENTGASLRMCLKCELVCPLVCLPLIAAAMEYAKTTAYWFSLPYGIKHPDDARAEKAMTDAETRVLEVFK